MTKNTLDRTSSTAVFNSLHEGNSLSVKKMDASISYVGTTGAKLDGTIHATAVACIYLSMPHADSGHNCAIRAERLINAMPKSSRRKALIAWFEAYSNVRFVLDKQGSAKGHVLKPTAKSYKIADPASAMLKPFWTVEEKATDAKDFTSDQFAAAVAALIKRATADNANLDEKGMAALTGLQDIAKTLPSVAKGKAGMPAMVSL